MYIVMFSILVQKTKEAEKKTMDSRRDYGMVDASVIHSTTLVSLRGSKRS